MLLVNGNLKTGYILTLVYCDHKFGNMSGVGKLVFFFTHSMLPYNVYLHLHQLAPHRSKFSAFQNTNSFRPPVVLEDKKLNREHIDLDAPLTVSVTVLLCNLKFTKQQSGQIAQVWRSNLRNAERQAVLLKNSRMHYTMYTKATDRISFASKRPLASTAARQCFRIFEEIFPVCFI